MGKRKLLSSWQTRAKLEREIYTLPGYGHGDLSALPIPTKSHLPNTHSADELTRGWAQCVASAVPTLMPSPAKILAASEYMRYSLHTNHTIPPLTSKIFVCISLCRMNLVHF